MNAKTVRATVIAVLLCLCVACDGCVVRISVDAPLAHIYGAQPLSPEGWWKDVYDLVETCAAGVMELPQSGDFSDLEWFIVPAGVMAPYAGLWSPPDRIYLDAAYAMNLGVLAHEMLHNITQVVHDQPELWTQLHATCVLPMIVTDTLTEP